MLRVGSSSFPTCYDFSLRYFLSYYTDFLRLTAVSSLMSLFSVVEITRVFSFSSVVADLWDLIFFRPTVFVSSTGSFFFSSKRYSDRVSKIVNRPLCPSFLYSILGIPCLRSYVYKIRWFKEELHLIL